MQKHYVFKGCAANLLTRDLHPLAILSFSFHFFHLEVGTGKMYQYMAVCVLIF